MRKIIDRINVCRKSRGDNKEGKRNAKSESVDFKIDFVQILFGFGCSVFGPNE